MADVPWHRSPKPPWIAAGVAAVILAVGLPLMKRIRDENTLFRRALSAPWTEASEARTQIVADFERYSSRIWKMLQSGDDDEVALAADTLLNRSLDEPGVERVLRLARNGRLYRRLRAAILLWWNRRHEEELRTVAAEIVKSGNVHLGIAFVEKLYLQVDPPHDREVADLSMRVLDGLHREDRGMSEASRDEVDGTALRWAHSHEELARPLLEARAASPDAMPWHRETLRHLDAQREEPYFAR